MKSPSEEIARYLAANGVGTFGASTGWCVGYAAEPAEPATAITVYDTPGQEPDTEQLDLLRPHFQVRVRGDDYDAAYDKQVAIMGLLTAAARTVITESTYVLIVLESDIMTIGRDQNENYILVANYRAMRGRS